MIQKILKSAEDAAICFDSNEEREPFTSIYRVSTNRVLILRECSRGAYQSAYQIWEASDTPPYEPQQISIAGQGTEIMEASMEGMVLSSFNKGRGISDCYNSSSWGWTGQQFELIESKTTPQCNGIVGGGFSLSLWRSRDNTD